jgi:hypothetical protein
VHTAHVGVWWNECGARAELAANKCVHPVTEHVQFRCCRHVVGYTRDDARAWCESLLKAHTKQCKVLQQKRLLFVLI